MFIIIIGVVILLSLIVMLLVASFTLVRQSEAIVVERLGKFHRVLGSGIHFIIPIIDRRVGNFDAKYNSFESRYQYNSNNEARHYDGEVLEARPVWSSRINMKERVEDFPKQSVITKDNAVVDIDTVVYLQVTDPKLFIYGAESPIYAVEQLTATTLRNIVGELELDEALTSRDLINKKLCYALDEASDAWGIKILRVEVKDITPPPSLQEAMHKQMTAERERRAVILEAEGKKQSEILVAEGQSEATILKANATANAVKLINEANPSAAYLTLEGYKAIKDLADGQATKIVVPSEIQNISGLLASLKAVVSEQDGARSDQ